MVISLDRLYLQTQIQSLSARKQKLLWLTEQGIQGKRIANFGCNIGGETLALVWAFGADEATGIDRDEISIREAQSTLASIREDVMRIWRKVQYYPQDISAEDKKWWLIEVPDLFKREITKDSFHVSYVIGDITKPTELQSAYYDIAYCNFVLHHIWYDEARNNAQDDTLFAITEMARVVRPGGVVVATEFLQCSDKPKLDFRMLFERAGLRVNYENATEVNQGTFADCLCENP